MKKFFITLACLLLASVAMAQPPQYSMDVAAESPQYGHDGMRARAVQENKAVAIGVGCDAPDGGLRCDWYQEKGYAVGVHWFAPDKGDMYYSGPTKPKLAYVNCANGKCEATYFPPAQLQQEPIQRRGLFFGAPLFRGVRGGGGCASGNCGG